MRRLKKWPSDPLTAFFRLAILAVLAGGCASGSRDAGGHRALEGPAMDLAQELYLRAESLKTLAARGAASYETEGRRRFFRFEAFVMKPDRLQFTAFDPAGRPAFRLVAADGRLEGLIYGARQYFTGPASPENLARFLPLNLTLDQLVALLSGSITRPLAAGARTVGGNTELVLIPAEFPEDENEIWRLRLSGGLDQPPRQAVILSAARGPANRPNLSLRYPTVRELPRADAPGLMEPFPASVEAEWPREKQHLRLTYDEISLNPPLDPSLFALTSPADFETVLLP